MTVFEKLNLARIKIQNTQMRKSGKNKFAGYSYFELTDILPVVNVVCNEVKACCVVSFGAEIATLRFYDAEKPSDFIEFSSPMSTATLKGCHEVQNLGAVETYIKRYLYQNAFEIAEYDGLDLTQNPSETQSDFQGENDSRMSNAQSAPTVPKQKLESAAQNQPPAAQSPNPQDVMTDAKRLLFTYDTVLPSMFLQRNGKDYIGADGKPRNLKDSLNWGVEHNDLNWTHSVVKQSLIELKKRNIAYDASLYKSISRDYWAKINV